MGEISILYWLKKSPESLVSRRLELPFTILRETAKPSDLAGPFLVYLAH